MQMTKHTAVTVSQLVVIAERNGQASDAMSLVAHWNEQETEAQLIAALVDLIFEETGR